MPGLKRQVKRSFHQSREWQLEKVLINTSKGRLTNCEFKFEMLINHVLIDYNWRILMMQENGLINHWLGQELFNMTIKNSWTAHNHLSNVMNCMTDVLKMEKEFHLNKTQFLKVTLNGLRFLFYMILGGFALSITIFIWETMIFFWLMKLCYTSETWNHVKSMLNPC